MASTRRILRFKVELLGIKPPIWRRIEIPASYMFWDLHVAIQDAMGWWDQHLHMFRIAGPDESEVVLIGIPDESPVEGDPEILPGSEVRVMEYLFEPGGRGMYEYDFGDGWEHEILLEDILPRKKSEKYPRCLSGARACPPEDCGGVTGYKELIKIIDDRSHEEYDEMMQWLGGSYDPDAFDANAVQFDSPKKRFMQAFWEE